MKKKLFGIIAALSCFACLGGCLDDKAADKDSTGGTSEGGSVAGVNLEAAKAILKSMYFEDEYTNNNVDYEYVTILQNVAGVDYQIEWSVNVTEGVVLENKGGTVLVNVNEGAMNAIDYVLTAKIVAPDGSSIEQQFIRTVKAMDKYVTNGITETPVAGKDYYLYVYQTTLAQHMYFTGNMDGYYFETTANAEEAVAINVEFVEGSTTNFYPYFVKDVEDTEGNVTKDVKHYIGMRLSDDGAHNNVVFDTAPITEFYYSTKYQTVVTKMATDKDGNTNAEFYLGNYAANDTISGSLASQYFGGAGNNVGNLVEIVDRTTVPNADKVKTTLDTLSVSAKYYEAATERLAERGVMFLETTVAWTSSNTDLIAIDGYNMTVNMPTEATEVTITATATCGDATDTKEFKVNLIPLPYAREATLTIPQALELAQVVGGDYTPGKYYVEGTVKSIANTTYGNLYIEDAEGNELYVYGTYDATGANRYDKMENAPQVGDTVKVYGVLGTYKDTAQFKNAWVVEHKAAEGGEVTPPEGGEDETPDLTTTEGILKALYALADGESLTGPFTITGKITALDNYSNPTIVVEGFENMPVYCYKLVVSNAVGDTITVTAGSMKNYQGKYEFMDCTLVSSEVGGGEEGGEDVVVPGVVPEVGKAYIFGMTQANVNNTVYYLAGGMDGYYMATTEDASAAIATYIEATDGGYYFYTYVDDVKTYINMVVSGEHVNGAYQATASTVYTIDEKNHTLIAMVNDTDYWFGTRNDKTYTTMGPCAVSYKGFFGVFYETEIHEHNYEAVVTAPTCTEAGYTTYTCACGDSYTADEVAATGHSYVDGACSVCGLAEVHEHNYEAVVTAPTCTEAGYTTYTCACGDSYTEEGEAATGHSYNSVVTDPTCGVAGYTTYTCSLCNDSYVADEVAATGEHSGYAEDYKCDACSMVVEPEADTTLTLAQAIKLADALGAGKYSTNSYYLTCEIVNIYNTTYGNANVTDADGTDYVLYGLYEGDTRYDSLEYKPVKGDTITVYGPVGSYNATSYQMKNAQIKNVVAHEHDYQAVVTEPTCTADGYTTHTCSICENTYTDSEVAATGHNYVEGTCSVCGAVEGAQPVVSTLATFDFGANGATGHVDGSDLGASKSYTVGSYSLALTNMSKVYGPAYDETGNSCIKLGTSSVVGTFTFTVPENVTEVVIYVAKYKAKTSKISVNGTSYTLTNSSNDGKYDEIKVDTTTTKTITFTTVSGGARAMVNTIIFNGIA